LVSHLTCVSEFEVVGTASTGEQAIECNQRLKPDVITLDLDMPGLGGMAALERMMEQRPVPVVLLSGLSQAAVDLTVRALAAGAIDFIPKYRPGTDTDPEALKRLLISKIRTAAGVKVLRSFPRTSPQRGMARYAFGKPSADLICTPAPTIGPYPPGGVIVIGASTGGPTAIRELLNELSTDHPAAVVLVQHLPAGFTRAFAELLDRQTPLAVKEAVTGDRLRPGFALVAPGEKHLTIRNDGRVEVSAGPKVSGHRPSVDVTMRSAATVYGPRTVGVLLTGMGADGADGLRHIREAGGRTFAQDAVSCAVNGMPQRAEDLGVVECRDTPTRIGTRLFELARTNHPRVAIW
jgi:two-component system chemotaxis response regulator CheB